MVGKLFLTDLENYLGKKFEVLTDKAEKFAVREVGNPAFYQWNKKDFAFKHLEGNPLETAKCFSLNDFFKLIVKDQLK